MSMATAREENDDEDLSLPGEYRCLPLIALQTPARTKLAKFLDFEGEPLVVEIDSETCDTFSDIFGLAELAGMGGQDIAHLKKSQSPTMKFLELWNKKHATVGNLWKFLMILERVDVIQDCRKTVLNDCRVYGQQNPRKDLTKPTMSGGGLAQTTRSFADGGHGDEQYTGNDEMKVNEYKFSTKDDVENNAKTFYDAFVCFTDEDLAFVKELILELEGKRGLKLFVPGRDDLPGSAECVISAYLIEKRCRKMLIIISNKFLRSAVCDFQVQFARALSKGSRNRKLITIVKEKGVFIPRILRYRAHCDFTKVEMKDFVYSKLIQAITDGAGIINTEETETAADHLHDSMGFSYPDCRRLKFDENPKDASTIEYNDLSANGLRDVPHTEPKHLEDRSWPCNRMNMDYSPGKTPRSAETMNITECDCTLSIENNETSLTEPKLPHGSFSVMQVSCNRNTEKAKSSDGNVKEKRNIKHCILKTFKNIKARILKGNYYPRESDSDRSHKYLSSSSCNLSSCPDNNHVLSSEDLLGPFSNSCNLSSCPDNNHVFPSEDILETSSSSCGLSSCPDNNHVLFREEILVPRSSHHGKYQEPVENSCNL